MNPCAKAVCIHPLSLRDYKINYGKRTVKYIVANGIRSMLSTMLSILFKKNFPLPP